MSMSHFVMTYKMVSPIQVLLGLSNFGNANQEAWSQLTSEINGSSYTELRAYVIALIYDIIAFLLIGVFLLNTIDSFPILLLAQNAPSRSLRNPSYCCKHVIF